MLVVADEARFWRSREAVVIAMAVAQECVPSRRRKHRNGRAKRGCSRSLSYETTTKTKM